MAPELKSTRVLSTTLLLCLLFAISLLSGLGEPDYANVEKEIQRGELTAATTTLEQALAANERDFQAHLLLGIVLQEQGHPDRAIKEFDRARGLRPNDPSPYVNIGKTLTSLGDLEAAAGQFSIAVRLDPSNATAYGDWGILLFHQQRWNEAITELRKAVALAPGDGVSWSVLFQAYLAVKDFQSARAVSAQIEHLSPPSADTFGTLGGLQAKAGDYPAAITNLQKALEIDPDSFEAAYNLSLAWFREGQLDNARAQLEKLRKTHDDADVEDLLGEVYEAQGRPLDAVRSLERAVALDPQNENYCFGYLTELLSHKSYDAAILVGNAAVRNMPDSVRLRVALVAALYGAGKNQQGHDLIIRASQDFPNSSLPLYFRIILAEGNLASDPGLTEETERYLAGHPRDPLGLFILGRLKDMQGDPRAAISLLNQSLVLGRDSAETQLTIAKVYSELQNWQQVIVHSSRAVQLRPNMSEAWYRLARALNRVGRKSEGDAAMKRFLRLRDQQKQSPVSTFLYTLR